MISVLNMAKTGVVDNIPEFKFEFEFDSASTLPVKTYVLGQKTYLIAKDSTAKNLSTNTYYKYGGVDDKWVKVLPTPTPTPVDNTKITDNGDYSLINNDFTGYNEVSVDVDNSFTPVDEGKVVSDGALIAQTSYPTEITENDTYDTTNYNSITVNVSGGGISSDGDVRFLDYDGTVVQSYSADDFANLSAMPANPSHEGLTAQGWNWSLADAKTHVAANGKLDIGQMYITSDGKTRLYYVIPKDSLTLDLYLTLDSDTELDVDWGDNSQHTTWTSSDGDSSKTHTYANGGRYTVAITVVSGGFSCKSSDGSYTLKKAELGSGVTSIGARAFYDCYSLSSITIPNSATSIGDYAFNDCQSLKSITIPSSVTIFDSQLFYNCCALTSVSIPKGVKYINNDTFEYCVALTSITLPNTVLSIAENAFYGCQALTSITIPNSVTSIGYTTFGSCYALTLITFVPTTPPTITGSLDIPKTCIIRVPQGTLSAYTSASNYPNPSSYIYEEY